MAHTLCHTVKRELQANRAQSKRCIACLHSDAETFAYVVALLDLLGSARLQYSIKLICFKRASGEGTGWV
jgi:hypothetical protein